MKITIYETPNGCIVTERQGADITAVSYFASDYWSFNSTDKAIAHIRSILKRWRDNKQPVK